MPGEPIPEGKQAFHGLTMAKDNALHHQDAKFCLTKWGMNSTISCGVFCYKKPYHKLQAREMLDDMFNSQDVQRHLQGAVGGKPGPAVFDEAETSVSFEMVPATVTNMSLFDRLMDNAVLRKDGVIIKCMEEFVDGFQVSDKLRDMLLNPDSDNAELYSSSERGELLFCIFQHLCLGGAMNQFEDSIDAYLKVSKLLYKDLVSVHRNAATNEVEVSSAVYKITAISSGQLFPHKGRNNFCYVSIDMHKRQSKLLYHAVTPFW